MTTIARMGRKPLNRITRTITLSQEASKAADKRAAKESTTLSAILEEAFWLLEEQRKAKGGK